MTKLDTLKQQTAEMEAKLEETTEKLKSMKAEIERLENGWEMKCPYKDGDKYYFINDDGSVEKSDWDGYVFENEAFEQGNTFLTRKDAELESKRRKLLTRFRAFRDECNNGWEPNWSNNGEKWEIDYKEEEGLIALWTSLVNSFSTFGYFKNKQDTQRAIDLFGDEIKELFMEGE